MQKPPSFASVIKNRGFLNLWTNQILVQLSYNALNFALIIWVYRLTHSNTAVSALLLSVYLPAVIFGLFAGLLTDITDRKKIIRIINLFLALLFLSLVFFKMAFLLVLLVAFSINTLVQFYNPAEASAIPLIVRKKQLLTANSLFTTTLFTAFLLGFGLSGPLITHLSINFVFLLGSLLLFLAFLLSFYFPSIKNKADKQGQKLALALKKRNLAILGHLGAEEISDTLNLIKGKFPVLFSILILASVQMVIGILAVMIPSFLEQELQIRATDASQFMVFPLGLGMVLGGFIIGKIGYKFPKRFIVSRAILMAGLLFLAVGVAPLIIPVIKYFPYKQPLPFFYQPPLSAILAIGSFLLGIAMVSIIIPSQTVLQENTPEQDRGKVFSVLGVVMQGLSLLPVLLTGIAADLFGAQPIFIGLGGVVVLFGLFALKPDFYFDSHHLPRNLMGFLGLGHWKKNS